MLQASGVDSGHGIGQVMRVQTAEEMVILTETLHGSSLALKPDRMIIMILPLILKLLNERQPRCS